MDWPVTSLRIFMCKRPEFIKHFPKTQNIIILNSTTRDWKRQEAPPPPLIEVISVPVKVSSKKERPETEESIHSRWSTSPMLLSLCKKKKVVPWKNVLALYSMTTNSNMYMYMQVYMLLGLRQVSWKILKTIS